MRAAFDMWKYFKWLQSQLKPNIVCPTKSAKDEKLLQIEKNNNNNIYDPWVDAKDIAGQKYISISFDEKVT